MLFSFFKDIATGVGFYAVSIPFFDEKNKLLQDNQDGERLRVKNLNFKFVLFSEKLLFLISITTRSEECL